MCVPTDLHIYPQYPTLSHPYLVQPHHSDNVGASDVPLTCWLP